MSKIITIGSASKDIFFPTREGLFLDTPEDILSQKIIAFELGAKYHIEERFESLGGCSVNVAAGLAKLGEDVSCYASIGDDAIGKWIGRELQRMNVGVESVNIEKDCQSDLSSILVDINSADRIIFSNQVANKKLIFSSEKIGSPQWIFIGDLSGAWQENIDNIIEASRHKKCWLAFNPRQKTIHEDVKKIIETITRCELLFVNKDEAIEIVCGCGDAPVRELLENEEYLVRILHRLGAKTVTVTDGLRGAWGFDGHQLFHCESLKQEAVDTTGAGDAFTSGFFAARIKGMDLKSFLAWGIANSSSSVMEYGGQKGLLTEAEINLQIDRIKIKSLNK